MHTVFRESIIWRGPVPRSHSFLVPVPANHPHATDGVPPSFAMALSVNRKRTQRRA